MRYQFLLGSLVMGALLFMPVESQDVCIKGRKRYQVGQSVPTKDPCEDCTCIQNGDDKPEVMCALMMCDMMCPGAIMDDGTCCGKCEEIEPVCKQGRKKYAIGETVPTGNPCEFCTCVLNDDYRPEVVCATMHPIRIC